MTTMSRNRLHYSNKPKNIREYFETNQDFSIILIAFFCWILIFFFLLLISIFNSSTEINKFDVLILNFVIMSIVIPILFYLYPFITIDIFIENNNLNYFSNIGPIMIKKIIPISSIKDIKYHKKDKKYNSMVIFHKKKIRININLFDINKINRFKKELDREILYPVSHKKQY